jgi:hypothetical protein
LCVKVALHGGTIVCAIFIFALTMFLPLDFFAKMCGVSLVDDDDDDDGDDTTYGGDDGGDKEDDELNGPWVVFPFCALWLLAVCVEQYGQSRAAVFMKLPFAAVYTGERMQVGTSTTLKTPPTPTLTPITTTDNTTTHHHH